ncbi:uncharacterized protein LOC132043321 [Lycium ferocissimum]|uniref:uncharacterized protein LOC132043321 n=1 Tax=Lycium ferocissimum TaxID=112874 RepID=UPI0028166F19|nr:uncharacterized protein LOC132043321 [Lycium ferocissimum]
MALEIRRETFPLGVNLESLEADPGIRKPIAEYNPNILDEVRRYYIQKERCQPEVLDFPKTKFGKEMRQFSPNWYKGRRKWLEYSITKDVAYCLCCYLFQNEHESNGNTSETYAKIGFKAWNKALERFRAHVGEILEKDKSESRRHLSASVYVTRFLLRLELSFRGHDESQCSSNRGIFLELLQWYGDINKDVGSIILENAPKNEMMYSPSIQKDIVDSCAKETIKAIIEDLDGDYFEILVDESKDISHKEQMEIVLRYVNKEGEVVERFVGGNLLFSFRSLIKSITNTGQGYDGASNMQGELNGLKTLILNETPLAYCIHCFAHQLHLALVALAKKNSNVDDFFCIVINVLNIVGASFKRRDLLREHHAEKSEELLISGEVHTGRGLNQERGLQDQVILVGVLIIEH